MKKNTLVTIGIIGGLYLLLTSFKKAGKLKGTVYVGQTNAPTGTQQVFSNIGTQIFDKNKNLIYTYDTANLGMTVIGSTASQLNVIIGSDFANGTTGYVNSNDVQTI
jgi:hypothetical protein